jgi:hypothetical protein
LEPKPAIRGYSPALRGIILLDRHESYQQKAAECLRMAQESADATNKALLLEMAQTWVKLAGQMKDRQPPKRQDTTG